MYVSGKYFDYSIIIMSVTKLSKPICCNKHLLKLLIYIDKPLHDNYLCIILELPAGLAPVGNTPSH